MQLGIRLIFLPLLSSKLDFNFDSAVIEILSHLSLHVHVYRETSLFDIVQNPTQSPDNMNSIMQLTTTRF